MGYNRLANFSLLFTFGIASLIFCLSAEASIREKTETVMIPDNIILLQDNGGAAVVVEKDIQKVFLYVYDGSYRKKITYDCSTGGVKGAKLKSGDKKTPEGVYYFTREYEKKYLSAVYGSRALPLDYPNFMDRLAGRNGSAIWMHGTNKVLKPMDSNGCVALENKNIDALAQEIDLNRTPIVIVDKITYAAPEENQKTGVEIKLFLKKWKEAFETDTYQSYLSHYDPDYVPDISWWHYWRKITENSENLDIEFKNISACRHREIYTVLFDQVVLEGTMAHFAGTRKLYLVKKGEDFKITGEEYLVIPEEVKGEKIKNPVVSIYDRIFKTRNADRDIVEMIDAWLLAWSSKDIERYKDFYADDFRANGSGKSAWIRHKRWLNRKYDYIHVSKENLKIKRNGDKCLVSFLQNYESSGHRAVGVKRLVLKRKGDQWKIYRENWKRK